MTKKKTPTPVKKDSYKSGNTTVEFAASVDILRQLAAENESLKTLLSKHQSEPMSQLSNPNERTPMLSQFADQMDGQLSRLYNSLNTLDSLSNRLVFKKQDDNKEKTIESTDLCGRLGNLLDYLSYQNDRLDILNAKLSDLI